MWSQPPRKRGLGGAHSVPWRETLVSCTQKRVLTDPPRLLGHQEASAVLSFREIRRVECRNCQERIHREGLPCPAQPSHWLHPHSTPRPFSSAVLGVGQKEWESLPSPRIC